MNYFIYQRKSVAGVKIKPDSCPTFRPGVTANSESALLDCSALSVNPPRVTSCL